MNSRPITVSPDEMVSAFSSLACISLGEWHDHQHISQCLYRGLSANSLEEFLALSKAIEDRIVALCDLIQTQQLCLWLTPNAGPEQLRPILEVAAVAILIEETRGVRFDVADFTRRLAERSRSLNEASH